MPRVSSDPKACVDPHGIVHETVGFRHTHTRCGWQRIWRELTPGNIWVNLRWKLVKDRQVTCLACISNVTPRFSQTPYKYVR